MGLSLSISFFFILSTNFRFYLWLVRHQVLPYRFWYWCQTILQVQIELRILKEHLIGLSAILIPDRILLFAAICIILLEINTLTWNGMMIMMRYSLQWSLPHHFLISSEDYAILLWSLLLSISLNHLILISDIQWEIFQTILVLWSCASIRLHKWSGVVH